MHTDFFLSAGQAGMAENVKAAGILLGGMGILLGGVLGGLGVLRLGYDADAIGEKGLTKIGIGIKGDLEGHMSAEAAGRQFGEEASAASRGCNLITTTPLGRPLRSTS